MNYGSRAIDEAMTFAVNTHDAATGAATDADAAPTYRIYEDETATAILTGTMALLDSASTTGFYTKQITLSAANGFETGKSYTIYISATVDGVTGTTSHTFQMAAPVRLSGAQSFPSLAVTGGVTLANSGGTGLAITGTTAGMSVSANAGTGLSVASTGGSATGMTISNTAGTALHIISTGGSGAGISSTGNAGGPGIYAAGGANGHGLSLDGSGTGDDLYLFSSDSPTLLVGLSDGAITAAKIASGAITNAKLAAGAISSVTFATDAIDDNAWAVPSIPFNTLMDAQGYTLANSESLANIHRASKAIIEGTCAAGASPTVITWTTISVTPSTNSLRGLILKFPRDTATPALQGQAAEIVSNTASAITVSPAFTADPDASDVFVIE